MYKLIEQYFEGRLSPEEKKRLFEKIDVDPDWKKEFVTLQNLRGLTAWAPNPSLGHADQSVKSDIWKNRTISGYIKHAIGYAAAILITFTLSWFIKDSGSPERENYSSIDDINYQEITTPAGQRVFVRLPDSTTIWLNARTTLRYPTKFTGNERRVELEGEAFFDVTENTASPFVVSTEKFNVQVTGTSFNVYAYKGRNEFNTSLTEGSVFIYDHKNEVEIMQLKANERVEQINGLLEKTDFSNMDFLLWKDGIYAFDDLPFSEIIKKLELYYDITIIVNNNNIRNFKFSGKFRQRDGVDRVLQTLQKIHQFSFTKDDDKNIITIK
ncbi:MAG: FecR family protein [Tannerella sp.]|jgi:ferric-dicitrate binding protein FerR (iron transport regulator)|nr:FecR family protein [Tannerella sp.]